MKYGIIGYGNMGKAICEGLSSENLFVTRNDISKFDKESFTVCENINDVITKSEIIILAVKPNKYEQILSNYDFKNKTIVSIGSGITSTFMDKYTNNYVLTMPNTACSINKSITPIVKNNCEMYSDVVDLFNKLGDVVEITEAELPNYVALLGSSPAYFYQYIEYLSNCFEIENSEQMLAKIMKSCADNILTAKDDSKTLKENVCSKGGCTIEYVEHMNCCKINDEIKTAVNKVIKKNIEMQIF